MSTHNSTATRGTSGSPTASPSSAQAVAAQIAPNVTDAAAAAGAFLGSGVGDGAVDAGVLSIAVGETRIGSNHVGKGTPNQDTWGANDRAGIYVVADGHGHGGEVASRSAVAELLSAVEVKDIGGVEEAITRAFVRAANVVDGLDHVCTGGTTATVAVVREGRDEGEDALVVVGNVGDSDAVVCGFGEDETARVISRRHRVDDRDERARCEAASGVVDRDGIKDNAAAQKKRISVTRALGDRDMRGAGVIDKPDVHTVSIRPPAFLLMATDGLWDAHGGVSPEDAADIVRRQGVREGLDLLMEMACGSEQHPGDDCTVLIVPIGCDGSRGCGRPVRSIEDAARGENAATGAENGAR